MRKFSLIIIIWLIFVNNQNILNFYKNEIWKKQFNQQNYIEALDLFYSAKNNFNIANTYYKLEKYQEAIEMYEQELKTNSPHELHHNIGNAYYFLSRQEKTSIPKRLGLLRKSLYSFQKAEILKNVEATINNKKIVEEEIQKLEDSEKKIEESVNNWEEESSDEDSSQADWESEEKSDKTGEEASNWKQNISEEKSKNQNQETTQKSKNWNLSKDGEDWLTEEQVQAIEKYADSLEKSQWEFWEFYNKVYKENQSEFESIFWSDPFFDNSLLEQNTDKKDW